MVEVSILLVDDQKLYAEALGARLAREPDISVVGVTTDPDGADFAIKSLCPDLVLINAELNSGDGVGLGLRLKGYYPAVRLLLITGSDSHGRAQQAVGSGISAWITKDAPIQDLLAAIRSTVKGEIWLSPAMMTSVVRGLQNALVRQERRHETLGGLTPREKEVVQWMVEGLDRSAIARELFLSPNTVRTHTRNIMAKLNVHSSLEAVSLAMRAGIRPLSGAAGEPPNFGHRARSIEFST